MTVLTPNGEDNADPARHLKAAIKLFEEALDAFEAQLAEIKRDIGPDKKKYRDATADIRACMKIIYEEKHRFEKLLGDEAGPGGAGLDLDAARDEIGRRLDRLRAAGPAG